MVELPGVVLITGAASGKKSVTPKPTVRIFADPCIGIDRATALAFAQAGCGRLTLVDLNREGLDTTKSLILVSHPDAQVDNEVGNTTLQAFTEHMVTNTVSTYGRLDYAVNCAGTIGPPALSHEVDLEEYDRIMNVNHRGTFLSSRAELRAMIGNESSTPDESQSQRGAIVNVASTWGMDGARGFCEYRLHACTAVFAITISKRAFGMLAFCCDAFWL